MGHLLQLLMHYRYAGIFVMFTTEMVGAPFPAETTLTAAGVLWARGVFSFWPLWSCAVLGNIAGSSLSYALGRWVGEPLLQRFGRFIGVTAGRLDKAQRFFARRRMAVIVLGKFLSVIRLLAPFLAGVNRMSWWLFSLVNGLTACVWATLYLMEGRLLNRAWIQFHRLFGIGWTIAIAVALLVCLSVLGRRRNRPD